MLRSCFDLSIACTRSTFGNGCILSGFFLFHFWPVEVIAVKPAVTVTSHECATVYASSAWSTEKPRPSPSVSARTILRRPFSRLPGAAPTTLRMQWKPKPKPHPGSAHWSQWHVLLSGVGRKSQIWFPYNLVGIINKPKLVYYNVTYQCLIEYNWTMVDKSVSRVTHTRRIAIVCIAKTSYWSRDFALKLFCQVDCFSVCSYKELATVNSPSHTARAWHAYRTNTCTGVYTYICTHTHTYALKHISIYAYKQRNSRSYVSCGSALKR